MSEVYVPETRQRRKQIGHETAPRVVGQSCRSLQIVARILLVLLAVGLFFGLIRFLVAAAQRRKDDGNPLRLAPLPEKDGTVAGSRATEPQEPGQVTAPARRTPRRRATPRAKKRAPRPPWWKRADGLLLAGEIFAAGFVITAVLALGITMRELNGTYRVLQRAEPELLPTIMAAAVPQSAATAVADTGFGARKLPPRYAAAPLLPTPFPTSTPARQPDAPTSPTQVPTLASAYAPWIEIPAIDVRSFVFPETLPDMLQIGVVQYGAVGEPGMNGNLVLAAHNDIYGAVFRDLDQLDPGDEILYYYDFDAYRYRVRESFVVEPHEIWVMQPTDEPILTLISCYPYLIDSKRIVVIGDFVPQAYTQ